MTRTTKRTVKRRWALLTGVVALMAWSLSSCSPSGFQSETVIDSVRILASRASEPRAKPGDTVTLDLLAYDGRSKPSDTMKLFWLPVPCVNPAGDAYYACFSHFGQGPEAADAGGGATGSDASAVGDAAAGALGLLRPGVDLTSALVAGASFTLKMPSNAVIVRAGASPYGLLIVFNFACAGHIELVAFDPNSHSPQQLPVGCFDSNHRQVGPDAFVFGFTRVYVEDDPKEVNPVITQVYTGAGRLAVDGGTTAPFEASLCEGDADTCTHEPIGPVVPRSLPANKQVWADFFATAGTFTSSARLLYDPMATLSIPASTDDEYVSPNSLTGAPSQNFVWIVVHDDQGGADWVTVPLQLK